MMAGVNDSVDQAETLATFFRVCFRLRQLDSAQPRRRQPLRADPWKQIEAFQDVLRRRGISCTVRMTRGDEIEGACGQLRAAVADMRKQA